MPTGCMAFGETSERFYGFFKGGVRICGTYINGRAGHGRAKMGMKPSC